MAKLARDFMKYCELNNLAKVHDYLSRGIDVNTVDGRQETALMIAFR